MDNWGQGTFTLYVSRLYRRAILLTVKNLLIAPGRPNRKDRGHVGEVWPVRVAPGAAGRGRDVVAISPHARSHRHWACPRPHPSLRGPGHSQASHASGASGAGLRVPGYSAARAAVAGQAVRPVPRPAAPTARGAGL